MEESLSEWESGQMYLPEKMKRELTDPSGFQSRPFHESVAHVGMMF